MSEIWKTITGNSKYEISSFGNVRSKDSTYNRVVNGGYRTWHHKGRILKISVSKSGYPTANLRPLENEIRRTIMVHRLVWEAFGNRFRKKNEDVDHINGIKTDNRIENLRLLTRSENMIAHYKLTGTRGGIKKTKEGMFQVRFNINKRSYYCGNYFDERNAKVALKAFLRLFDNEKL